MKYSSKLLLSAAAASIGLAMISFPVNAGPNHNQIPDSSNKGAEMPMEQGMNQGMMRGNMMQMMHRMHARGGDHMGYGMMGNHMGANLHTFDTDDDGSVSAEELRNGLLAELKKYDTDGDGTLSIGEFELLHSAHNRNKMVDRFQALDEDGDGKVTKDEISARADKMEKRMKLHSTAMPMNQMKQMHSTTPENN
jgi:Ca2+-binding EF-hand superfamily protein